jgi:high frequency lysogenization protein
MANRDNIVPLAGMFQAGYMVYDLAHTGRTNEEAYKTSINSILITDPKTTEDVYGGINGVQYGLNLLCNIFDKSNKVRDMEIARYVLGIIHLEKKLRKLKEMDARIVSGISLARNQAEVFGSVTHENVIANIADTYTKTISTIQPQILVAGEPEHLTNTLTANKIRALLMALMRSTVLWLQKGGSRWDLIFQRKKIIELAKITRSA